VHKQKTRISKREVMPVYGGTFTCPRCRLFVNPAVKALYERLTARGMVKMAALAAAMRKLLMIAYGS